MMVLIRGKLMVFLRHGNHKCFQELSPAWVFILLLSVNKSYFRVNYNSLILSPDVNR